MPNPSIKNERLYRELREDGESKEKAARVSNAVAAEGQSKVSSRGGRAGSYDDWTVERLRKRAAEIGIDGRSSMNKKELVQALRDH
ncbi:MAG TPA: Rho termination factor [Actinokineospora sp.]|jgi:hypothetical protein|nr:Rho termination factor [Actinokineospora sp.]